MLTHPVRSDVTLLAAPTRMTTSGWRLVHHLYTIGGYGIGL